MTRRTKAWLSIGTAVALTAASFAVTTSAARATDADPATQQYRPSLHYTPEANWMNDPNGLVYHNGKYHMYYQYNPNGTRWGDMSWGHASSTDLIHWEEQPLAISRGLNGNGQVIEEIFSGSVVVDTHNSSGFGTLQNPPLVAVYTSNYTGAHPLYPGKQAQSLAFSLDDGQSWTKYGGNPVLSRNTPSFRDPKVFWYDNPSGGDYWVMAAVEADEHRVLFYKSSDLKQWEYLDDFGPANAVGGQWECPDLFPLAVDGNPNNVKWVLAVNINPGAVGGGSGGQYFVGDFNGTTFTAENIDPADQLPPGNVLAGFNGGNYGGWNVQNDPSNGSGPWGSAPASGTIPGQQQVTGHIGAGLVNGFHGGDTPVGTMESAPFTVDKDYLNFLIGGGKHAQQPGQQSGNQAPPGYLLFDGFDYPGTLSQAGWQLSGDFQAALNPSTSGGEFAYGKRINTFEGGPYQDNNVGTITSPEFYLTNTNIAFLLGGGERTDGQLQVELLVGGVPVRTTTGTNSGDLNWKNWDVSPWYGQIARIRIVDNATGPWGHLTLDNMVLGSEPAKVRSSETTVNLVVNGQTVRSATGANSEHLAWNAWDVSAYKGSQATIRIVDNNRGGWGHILADEFVSSDASHLEQHDWLDWGRDYYATVSFNNAPDGKRIMLGWMNNWDYGQDTPTSTWRGSMALPREVVLTQTPAGPRLRQQVVSQADALKNTAASYTASAQDLQQGTTALPITGDVVQIDAEFSPGSASAFGLKVLGNANESTRIGYATASQRLSIDRTNSGNEGFHPAFSSVEDAKVELINGRLHLRVYVDRASVEVFAQDGLTTLTDQVFPGAGATAISVFSEGGTARLESLTVTPLNPAMWGG
ncbi:GH32 C-terminal domain-containing protein [Paenarthrobacter sp. A20]|uniref:GH32 C-terminal domain-containing protein n=1 Tax=Paenarthrobacter sp. A20 TaxID=2817891 RepID=UPI00209F417B|nr:GH32 C-terminal domain-containing protein [Paenarthrobacter sp. A20]MCP1412373.1 levanase [Paenarthrobacter sp. A20]